ncbi:MAG TPA: AAA family ATPase [Clostridia bacterium]|nr:AAA family ATPase [Clostridia bacterium]
MKRMIEDKLNKWKVSGSRKPLLLMGARQVGKTYSCLEFGKNNYQNVVYLNFEGDMRLLHDIFREDLEPARIVQELSYYSKQAIIPEKTLIIFDEIQACEMALNSLKYFCENAPQYNIIAAASLLGIAINRGKYSFPVGKVDMVTMYPMSFDEFLYACGKDLLLEKIKESFSSFKPLSAVYHEEALSLYHSYLVIGGYPAVVKTYLEKNDFNVVKAQQANIANAYIADMAKYSTPNITIKSTDIFNTLPAQLAKENTKFRYNIIKSSARAKDYELSLQWLKAANVVLESIKATEAKHPLSVYQEIDSFKIYYSDVGLLSYKAGIQPQDVISNITSDRARGMLAENYVAQQLVAAGYPLNYWQSSGTAEIDFIIRIDDSIIPIEVKSADNVRSRSLSVFADKYNPDYAIRFSTKNFGYENSIKSIPLYAVFCL